LAIAEKIPESWAKKPPERVWSAACRSYGAIWGIIGTTVSEDLGKAGIEAVRRALRKVAEKQATRAFESGRYPRNAKGVAEYMKFAEETLGMIVEVPEATERRSVFRILKCPLYEDPERQSAELCDAYAEFEETAAKTANPKLKCTITKLLSKGDPYCEWVFELEE